LAAVALAAKPSKKKGGSSGLLGKPHNPGDKKFKQYGFTF